MTVSIKRLAESKGLAGKVQVRSTGHGLFKSPGNDNGKGGHHKNIPPATYLSFPAEDSKWELDWY